MKKTTGKILLAIAILVLMFLLASCGKEATSTVSDKDAYEPPSEDCIITIEESGWTYSKNDECIYYAVVLKNNSKQYICETPSVSVTVKNEKGKTLGKEEIILPDVEPGKTVSYGSAGAYSGKNPADVKFRVIESRDWSDISDRTASIPLNIIDAGTREYDDDSEYSDEEKEDDIDYEDEFDDIDDIFGDMDSSLQQEVNNETKADKKANDVEDDADRDELMNNARSIEYYGKIVNENKYDINEALVCILFRDGQGKLIGGENGTVRDIKGNGITPFSIVSSCGLSVPTYEFFVYLWK